MYCSRRIALLFAVLLFASCSAADISGTYVLEGKPSMVLRLTQEKKFLVDGNAGEYSVDGKKILLLHIMGGAEGTLAGDRIVFPQVSPNDLVGKSMTGTWVKK